MGLKLITTPETYPVTMVEAKGHLRASDFTDDDTMIELYLQAAIDSVQKFTGRALVDQTWDYVLDAFPVGEIKIPLPPLIEIVGLFYRDSAGDEQEFDAAGYTVDDLSELARIALPSGQSWPTPQTVANAVRIRFRAGHVDNESSPPSGSVPFALKAAILLTLGTLYANRETIVIGQTATMLPWSAEQLSRPYRVHVAFA